MIGEFAERMRVAVLSVTHFSKAGANTTTKALHRFIGSIAFVGAPRVALAVIEDTANDRLLFLHAKNNLAPPPQGLAYRVKEKIVGEPERPVTAPHVVFDAEHVNVTADEVIKPEADEKHYDRNDAKDFLAKVLEDGPVAVVEVNKQAAALGISERTLKRARADMGVQADKGGFDGGWQLSLPRRGPTYPEEGHVNTWHPSIQVAPLGDDDAAPEPSPEGSFEEENKIGPSEKNQDGQSGAYIVVLDERFEAMKRTEERLRREASNKRRAAANELSVPT